MTRVLVCGGRDYNDAALLWAHLRRLDDERGITCVIHGAARGADSLAADWARKHIIPAEAFPADWGLHGRAAGFIRNAEMLEQGKPDLVLAFPGGKGTAMMVRLAKKAGVEVIEIVDDEGDEDE